MTNNLKDVIFHLLKHYPNKEDSSNARITKMVYLSDWHQAINYGRQITDIKWYFDTLGPYVNDVKNEVINHSNLFEIKHISTSFGQNKKLLSIKDKAYEPNLLKNQIDSIEHVIKVTKQLNWSGFIKLVYSTYPIFTSEKYSFLDLIQKAKEYSKKKLNW